MARCSSCSAPLPANSPLCEYCGTRNDLDFIELDRYALSRKTSTRMCPLCQKAMQSISLTPDGSFAVERCEHCFGLFFDPGEIQAFLDRSVSPAYEVNLKQIYSINRERAQTVNRATYIKCPQCGKYMNRVNFGFMSGVVMDRCREHGVWLDNGELVQLMEWKKAGGAIMEERKLQQKKAEKTAKPRLHSTVLNDNESFDQKAEAHLLGLASSLLERLFS